MAARKMERRRALARSAELRQVRTEVRAKPGKGALTVTGTAIRYGVGYQVSDAFGTFTEVMHAGVLSAAALNDVRFLVNHAGIPLARTLSGTLVLTDSPAGLNVRADLSPKSQTAQDLYSAVERGDVSQMSIGFVVAAGGDSWSLGADGTECRDVFAIDELFDVSAVAYAASPTTTIELAGAFERRSAGRVWRVGYASRLPGKPSKLELRRAQCVLAAARQPGNLAGQRRAAQYTALAEAHRLGGPRKGRRK